MNKPDEPTLFTMQRTMPPVKATTTKKQAEDWGPLFDPRSPEAPRLPLDPIDQDEVSR